MKLITSSTTKIGHRTSIIRGHNTRDLNVVTPVNQLVKFAVDTNLVIPTSTADSRAAEM